MVFAVCGPTFKISRCANSYAIVASIYFKGNLFSGVSCSDPQLTFNLTEGRITNNQLPPFHAGHLLQFECPASHKLVGSRNRTCQANGLWSGIVSVCDLKGKVFSKIVCQD